MKRRINILCLIALLLSFVLPYTPAAAKAPAMEASSDAYRRTKNNAQNFWWNYPQKIFQEFKKEYRIGNF